jgi:hypothetical protein
VENEQLTLIEPVGEELEGEGLDDVAPAFPRPPRTGKGGRPPGARNKKTLALERYYQARGYRDPVAYLGDLVSSDPVELWKWFRAQTKAVSEVVSSAPTLLEIVELQRKAASDLAPYLHGKQPISDGSAGKALPVLIINTGTNQVDRRRAASGILSIGEALEGDGEIEENQ